MSEQSAKWMPALVEAARCWRSPPSTPRAAALAALDLARRPPPGWPTHLPPLRALELALHAVNLAAWVERRRGGASASARSGDPARGRVVGISGGQGSGKSTLAALTAAALERRYGLRTLVLSLDDLYLPREERLALAERVHPLFRTRGVPGTHDTALGSRLLEDLTRPAGEVAVPRFDKGEDDRLPRRDWPVVATPVDVVLFEGWVLGCPPQAPAALERPVNELERCDDPEGAWRWAVNAALAGDYAALFAHIDVMVMLRVPGFDAVRRWREAQETELRRRHTAAMDPEAVQRFVDHYERLTRHLLGALPGRADLVFDLDEDHAVRAVGPGGGWRRSGERGSR